MTNYEELENRSNELKSFVEHLERLHLTEKLDQNFLNLCKDVLVYIKNPYSSIKFLELMPYEINLNKNLLNITITEEDKRNWFKAYSERLLNLVNFTISCVKSNTL